MTQNNEKLQESHDFMKKFSIASQFKIQLSLSLR